VLSGLPSIVVGLFVYALIVQNSGYSAFAGSVALAILMLPVVLRTTEEMLKLVPKSLREASLALGAPEWKTSFFRLAARGDDGRRHGPDAGGGARGGRDRAVAVHGAGQQPISRPRSTSPSPRCRWCCGSMPLTQQKCATRSVAIALLILALVLVLNVAARLITLWRSKMMQ